MLVACGSKPRAPAPQAAFVSIVPQPQSASFTSETFAWPRIATMHVLTPRARAAVFALQRYVKPYGIVLTASERSATPAITFKSAREPQLGSEGYRLRVARDGVTIAANAGAGFFYGLQTLEQTSHGALRSQIGTVRDWPAFPWRGIHLDVSRHFFGPRIIERYIDVAAHYKLNVFHWHLTDDRAWRLEIPGYPRLTAQSDSYSPAQVREIVRYATERFVTVVPEIDLPAHSSAAIAAYPELGCGRAGVLCAAPRSAKFAGAVFDFAADIFPGQYVHIGGDEVPDPAVQTYFVRTLETLLKKRERRAVTWDDAMHASPSKSTVIMSWHGEVPGLRAARSGYDAVMTPDGPLYFDAYQGDRQQEPRGSEHLSTLEQVYDYDPSLEALGTRQRAHVLGVQANLWTEHIRSERHLFYMLLPRELALAEIAWTSRARKNWGSFLRRLPAQLDWLAANHYNFRVPAPLFDARAGKAMTFSAVAGRAQSVQVRSQAMTVALALRVPAPARIHYTLDGTTPSDTSPTYIKPLRLGLADKHAVDARAIAILPNGQRSTTSECIVQRATKEALLQRGGARSWESLVSP